MATSVRTSGIFLLLFLIISASAVSPPWILSVVKECKIKCGLKVISSGVKEWSLTEASGKRGALCTPPFVSKHQFLDVQIDVPEKNLYFCVLGDDNLWYHQGDGIYLSPDDVIQRLVQLF